MGRPEYRAAVAGGAKQAQENELFLLRMKGTAAS